MRNISPIATIESVGSSTRIEGVQLTDDEIEKLLAGVRIQSSETRDGQEVAGYADLMELIFESYTEIALSENHINQLHWTLLKYSSTPNTSSDEAADAAPGTRRLDRNRQVWK